MTADTNRRREIDGLRAVAVLCVVLFHAGVPGFDGGFVGVDFFFVISGFLITRLLVREYEDRGEIRLIEFWARRVRRIFPSLFVVLFLTLAVGLLILPPWERSSLLESARSAAMSIGNFYFLSLDGGYFASTTGDQPLLHTWSLGIEEQFYLAWPITVLVALRWGGRRSLAIWVGVVVVASFSLSLVMRSSSPDSVFYLPQTRVWELGIGAIVGVVRPEPVRSPTRTSASMALVALIGLGGSLVFLDEGRNFPSPLALIPVLSAALMIASTSSKNLVARILSHRFLVRIGRWSYGWYLFHWPALVMCRSILGGRSSFWDPFVCFATLGLAAINHLLVEEPCRKLQFFKDHPARRTVFAGVGAVMAVTAITSLSLTKFRENYEVSGEALIQVLATTTTEMVATSDLGGDKQTPTEDQAPIAEYFDWKSDIGLQLLDQSRVQVIWPCVDFGFNLPFSDKCEIRGGSRYVIAIGDSHVGSAALALERAAADAQLGLRIVGQPQCPIADVDVFLDDEVYGQCRDWASDVVDEIVSNRDQVAAVVWVVRSDYYFPGLSIAQSVNIGEATFGLDGIKATSDTAREVWERGVRNFLIRLDDASIPIVLVHNWPEFREWPSDCLAKRPIEECSISLDTYSKYRQPSFDAERAAVRGFHRSITVDPANVFCIGEICPMSRGSSVIFRDDNHLTPEGSLLLLPSFRTALELVLLE